MNKLKKINICVIRNDRIGDMILTLPIIKAIKENYPNSNISVVCSKVNSFLCEEAKFVDKFCIYDKNESLFYKIKFFKYFRKVSYDIVFNFSQSLDIFFLFLFSKSINKMSLIYLSRYGNPKHSKKFQKLIIKLFSIGNIEVDRNQFFKNKLNFHQTEMMYQLVKKKLDIKKPKVFHLIPHKKDFSNFFEERILIHLSCRWIDNNYSEDDFLELLTELGNKYGKIYLTTDQSSEINFRKIYQFYESYNDHKLHELSKSNQNIIILDKLNFKNWREAILNSKLVITYECGCVHVAAMSNVPLLVVYDYKNRPHMINKEYAPYTDKYQKVIISQERINQEIMTKLEKMEVYNFCNI